MENKKLKYYHIRANVFWVGMIVITLVFAVLIVSILKTDNVADQSAGQDEIAEKKYVEFGHIKSELKNVKECYLCGNSAKSLMGYFRKFDTIGVIGLNEWYVVDLHLKKYDGEGNVEAD